MALPSRVSERLAEGVRRFAPIVAQQRQRDVSEADTVTLVKDVLSEVFGYDKYAELTSEHAIRSTYCDLAVKVNDRLAMLIEVKSAGTALDDRHVKQAVDYATNQGVDWVVLTNAATWELYNVVYGRPIDKRLVTQVDLTVVDPRKDASLEQLYPFTREGFLKGACDELRDRIEATSRFTLAALLVENEAVLASVRRELRRVVDVLVDEEEILKVLREQVVKRETLEGPEAEAAARRVNRREGKSLRGSRGGPGSDAPQATAGERKPATAAPGDPPREPTAP